MVMVVGYLAVCQMSVLYFPPSPPAFPQCFGESGEGSYTCSAREHLYKIFEVLLFRKTFHILTIYVIILILKFHIKRF